MRHRIILVRIEYSLQVSSRTKCPYYILVVCTLYICEHVSRFCGSSRTLLLPRASTTFDNVVRLFTRARGPAMFVMYRIKPSTHTLTTHYKYLMRVCVCVCEVYKTRKSDTHNNIYHMRALCRTTAQSASARQLIFATRLSARATRTYIGGGYCKFDRNIT